MTSPLPTVIGLGRLVDFIIRDAQGRRLRVTPMGERWLAWKADTRDLVVLEPGGGVVSTPNRSDARRHRVFHGAKPKRARQMELPASRGSRRVLGLIESVTYTAGEIRSPSKGSQYWIHQFGDCGKHGQERTGSHFKNNFHEKLFPSLEIDSFGNLHIVRREHNIYRVLDWIIG